MTTLPTTRQTTPQTGSSTTPPAVLPKLTQTMPQSQTTQNTVPTPQNRPQTTPQPMLLMMTTLQTTGKSRARTPYLWYKITFIGKTTFRSSKIFARSVYKCKHFIPFKNVVKCNTGPCRVRTLFILVTL